jgi:aromatic-L-amino-acid/L-tryptophan decarboxylase
MSDSLEYSPETMRTMAHAVVDRVVAHLAALPTAPACGPLEEGAALARALREGPPEGGQDLAPLLDLLFDEVIPVSYACPTPGYMAYIPGGGLYPAALADYIANAVNRYTGIWHASPGLVQLEANTLDWLRDWMGFPGTTAGLYTAGGSMATFNAILCARERHLAPDLRAGTIYTSTQAHHCVVKAAKLAGIYDDRVRLIAVDADYRLRIDALADAIAADRRAGLRPFMVISSAGTTNTGAVDPLDDIAHLCAREGLWHHVDGAYGACFHMVPGLQALLPGLSRADSLTLDPHKGFFLPYGTGALLVRDGSALRQVHSATAGYLPDNQGEFYDPAQHGPELSRGFPGLRVWLSVKLFGAAAFREALAEKRALALWGAEQVAQIPGVVMDAWPQLSLFAFHLTGPSLRTRDDENRATAELLERVTRRGRVMLTGCTVDGRFLGRVCVLSFRTHREQLEACVHDLREEAATLLGNDAGNDAGSDAGSARQAAEANA